MRWTIKDVEEGLRKVRDQLMTGEITGEQFAMQHILYKGRCGTVGCIGGWMLFNRLTAGHVISNPMTLLEIDAVISGDPLTAIVDQVKDENADRAWSLNALFFDWSPDKPSTAKACDAIDVWLSGAEGNPWKGA